MTDEQIMNVVRYSTVGSNAIPPDEWCAFARALLARQPAAIDKQAAVAWEMDWPEYSYDGMGCGLEDRNITDRYEAMKYGWDEALERVGQILERDGPLYTAPPAQTEAETRND